MRDLVQGEAGQVRRTRNFLDLLEEVEETAGEVPLRDVSRRASQEAEREAIEQVLFHTGWNQETGRTVARGFLQDAVVEDPGEWVGAGVASTAESSVRLPKWRPVQRASLSGRQRGSLALGGSSPFDP